VKRCTAEKKFIFVAIEHIERLPDDPEWEKRSKTWPSASQAAFLRLSFEPLQFPL
jgi:hypothetical protein